MGFRVPSIPQNVNPTDDVQPFLGIGADGTDTNLFFISKPTLFGTISKVDTGIAKDTTDVLLLQMYRLKNTTTNFLKLTNLTTNSVVQTTFESTGFVTITNYISNNNSPQAIGYAIQRIKLKITD